jgi:hypothetical protein
MSMRSSFPVVLLALLIAVTGCSEKPTAKTDTGKKSEAKKPDASTPAGQAAKSKESDTAPPKS